MKFRTTAIAMAVAGVAAAPVAVQAGADEVYASARVGTVYIDEGGTADFTTKNMSSRFGMRGETDLGNGLSAFGRYEFSVNDVGSTAINLRHRYVGLKGDWGGLTLGQTNHTFYNYVVGPLDNPWWHSGYTMVEYKGRTDHAIRYDGGAGAIAFGATVYLESDSEETAPDGIELALSFGLGDSTLAVAISNVDEDGAIGSQGSTGDDEDIIGVAWSGIGIGDTSLGVSLMLQDEDQGVVLDWLFGNAYFHAEMLSIDATDQDQLTLTLGYTQSLGRKTSMWYEVASVDYDGASSDEDKTFLGATLKYDII
jgi:predicted porin